jgi:hypothetical protein
LDGDGFGDLLALEGRQDSGINAQFGKCRQKKKAPSLWITYRSQPVEGNELGRRQRLHVEAATVGKSTLFGEIRTQ